MLGLAALYMINTNNKSSLSLHISLLNTKKVDK